MQENQNIISKIKNLDYPIVGAVLVLLLLIAFIIKGISGDVENNTQSTTATNSIPQVALGIQSEEEKQKQLQLQEEYYKMQMENASSSLASTTSTSTLLKNEENKYNKINMINKEIYVHPDHEANSFNLPFWRDNEKLWKLEVGIEEIGISELEWMLDIPFWENENGDIVIRPREIINNPDKFPYHFERVKNADTNFAIDVMFNKRNNKLQILDGLHRYVKLYLQKTDKIKVRKIPENLIHLTAKIN